jgi:hypothetical protein
MAGALVRPLVAVSQSYVVELEPLMRRIAAILVLAIAVACGGSDATSPSNQAKGPAFTGTYTLQTVNGKTLPVTWSFNSGDSLRLRSYSISINGSGSWTSATSEVFSTNGQVTDQPSGGQSGSYTYDAATKNVTLISSDQSTFFDGILSTDFTTLTLAQNTDVFVFKR